MNYNRLGPTSDKDVFNALYIGYPWYIRGYNNLIYKTEDPDDDKSLIFNQLTGSKMIVSNFEIRIPFTGPKKLTLIGSRMFFSDLNIFADAGIIWDSNSTITLDRNKKNDKKKAPLISLGTSLRINLFGYAVLEPYYAFPIHESTR